MLENKVEQALDTALKQWEAMSGAGGADAEPVADEFQSSFYLFIDALREWVDELSPRPQTLEQLLELPFVQKLAGKLPAPLYLNFETEAELIIENERRIDDAKYD
jgi:hypothetical protein